MYFVYILQSQKDSGYYTGQTNNLESRLERHNTGQVASTKNRRPFRLIYSEKFITRKDSVLRERQIKAMKCGNQFKNLISK